MGISGKGSLKLEDMLPTSNYVKFDTALKILLHYFDKSELTIPDDWSILWYQLTNQNHRFQFINNFLLRKQNVIIIRDGDGHQSKRVMYQRINQRILDIKLPVLLLSNKLNDIANLKEEQQLNMKHETLQLKVALARYENRKINKYKNNKMNVKSFAQVRKSKEMLPKEQLLAGIMDMQKRMILDPQIGSKLPIDLGSNSTMPDAMCFDPTPEELEKGYREIEIGSVKKKLWWSPESKGRLNDEKGRFIDTGTLTVMDSPFQSDATNGRMGMDGASDISISSDSDWNWIIGTDEDYLTSDLSFPKYHYVKTFLEHIWIDEIKIRTSQVNVAKCIEEAAKELGYEIDFGETKFPLFNGVKKLHARAIIAAILGCDQLPMGLQGVGVKTLWKLLKMYLDIHDPKQSFEEFVMEYRGKDMHSDEAISLEASVAAVMFESSSKDLEGTNVEWLSQKTDPTDIDKFLQDMKGKSTKVVEKRATMTCPGNDDTGPHDVVIAEGCFAECCLCEREFCCFCTRKCIDGSCCGGCMLNCSPSCKLAVFRTIMIVCYADAVH